MLWHPARVALLYAKESAAIGVGASFNIVGSGPEKRLLIQRK